MHDAHETIGVEKKQTTTPPPKSTKIGLPYTNPTTLPHHPWCPVMYQGSEIWNPHKSNGQMIPYKKIRGNHHDKIQSTNNMYIGWQPEKLCICSVCMASYVFLCGGRGFAYVCFSWVAQSLWFAKDEETLVHMLAKEGTKGTKPQKRPRRFPQFATDSDWEARSLRNNPLEIPLLLPAVPFLLPAVGGSPCHIQKWPTYLGRVPLW